MTADVWMSSLISNLDLGFKIGVRQKRFDAGWDPEQHAPAVVDQPLLDAIDRYTTGRKLERRALPEAAAVWDTRAFARARDIFPVGGFYCVTGRLAEALSRFDLGEGGLVDFPLYEADCSTPYPGDFYLLNFGAVKDTLVPMRCDDARPFYVDKASGKQVFKLNQHDTQAKVVVTAEAMEGPDLWFEQAAHEKIFLSARLAEAIAATDHADAFRLRTCDVARPRGKFLGMFGR